MLWDPQISIALSHRYTSKMALLLNSKLLNSLKKEELFAMINQAASLLRFFVTLTATVPWCLMRRRWSWMVPISVIPQWRLLTKLVAPSLSLNLPAGLTIPLKKSELSMLSTTNSICSSNSSQLFLGYSCASKEDIGLMRLSVFPLDMLPSSSPWHTAGTCQALATTPTSLPS